MASADAEQRVWTSLKRSAELFHAGDATATGSDTTGGAAAAIAPQWPAATRLKMSVKTDDEYRAVKDMLPPPTGGSGAAAGSAGVAGAGGSAAAAPIAAKTVALAAPLMGGPSQLLLEGPVSAAPAPAMSTELVQFREAAGLPTYSTAVIQRPSKKAVVQPVWHAPWKLMRVQSGHYGWVHSVAVDATNEWFATGSADRTIIIWDLASGTRKLTLTGHINAVRGLAVSARHPYLFSAGDDKQVKCWDLEQNKVVRHYHGHLSGVYCIGVHPTLDLIVTGGRDSVARVWDMRRQAEIACLSGHESTVNALLTQGVDPQIITASADSRVKLWDLAMRRCITTLTHHKKGVRALAMHPTLFSFASGSADNIKEWKLPEGRFMQNLSGHNTVINTLSCNRESVLFSGGDNGTMRFWDWRSGYCFQELATRVQPGSLEAEAAILASTFDMTGARLITCEADKSIKIWREDETATPETHPINFVPQRQQHF